MSALINHECVFFYGLKHYQIITVNFFLKKDISRPYYCFTFLRHFKFLLKEDIFFFEIQTSTIVIVNISVARPRPGAFHRPVSHCNIKCYIYGQFGVPRARLSKTKIYSIDVNNLKFKQDQLKLLLLVVN